MKKRKTLGLALGAGSAKGFAHVGVLQVLEEEGIPVDYISGSSMGAVVGAIYACGTDLHLAAQLIPQIKDKDLFDVTMPKRGGFITGAKFMELIKLLTKDKSFDETIIPFTCVAVDLYTGKQVVIDSGKLYEGTRGSYAIPGVIEPYAYKGMLLVDGAVLNRVPTDVVKSMGADVVVGVDVGYRGMENGKYSLKCDKVRSIMYSSNKILQWEYEKLREAKYADLTIVPYVWDYDSNSMADAGKIIEVGKEAARQALPRLKELLEI